ncbi:uncharacterized protein LOC143233595 [Tachypleus tridentatus]|uniref:uncharacterized protein LOC143233595 n=1 Tax=Tachypleus tridentatus TaxID=6853 RepID=UPI003FD66FE9
MFHLLPHQIFATSQAIYIYVLDLNRAVDEPITAPTGFSETRPLANLTFTPLSLLHAWLTVLHLTVAQNNKINSNTDGGDLPEEEDGVPALRPPVVIVGMLRKSDNINEERQHITAEEMFVKIRESLRDSPYKHHVVPTCFMLDWRDTEKLEEHMEKLRETVRTLAVNQPQMPVEVPLRWLAFQREISNLLKKGVYMANYCQLYEVAQRQGISKEDEFWAMLNFLHDQGKLSSFPCNLVDKTRDKWEGIAVLSPQWFVNHIYKVFNPSLISNKTEQPKEDQSGGTSVTNGYLSDEYFNSVWSDVAACKQTFIGILENLDLLCELRKEKDPDGVDKKIANTYWIPWIARKQRSHTTTLRDESCCLRLYIDFHSLLPVGFFSRLVARLGGWSCRHEWTRLPQLSADQCRIAVHPGHDLLIEKALFAHAQIVVTVTRVFKPDHSDWSGKPPSVQVCEKVRHLLEAELETLRNSWYKRLSFSLCVSCPCKKTCVQHGIPGCVGHSCLHLLPLSDCLVQKTIQCEYRIVKTDFIRTFFPFSSLNVFQVPVGIMVLANGLGCPDDSCPRQQ